MISSYWSFWFGGIMIALVAVLLVTLGGQFLSITRGYAGWCSIISRKNYFKTESSGGILGVKSIFICGVVSGGFVAALTSGGWQPSWQLGMFDKIFGESLWLKATLLIAGGICWGVGSRLSGGCTSGNSISGISRGSLASLVTTICFLIAGAITTFFINQIGGY